MQTVPVPARFRSVGVPSLCSLRNFAVQCHDVSVTRYVITIPHVGVSYSCSCICLHSDIRCRAHSALHTCTSYLSARSAYQSVSLRRIVCAVRRSASCYFRSICDLKQPRCQQVCPYLSTSQLQCRICRIFRSGLLRQSGSRADVDAHCSHSWH